VADDETVWKLVAASVEDDVCFGSSLRAMIFDRIFSEFLNSFRQPDRVAFPGCLQRLTRMKQGAWAKAGRCR
jgi:hypothetical protein